MRSTTVIYNPQGLPPEWPDVAAVVLVGREREVKGVRTDTAHYDLTSRWGTAAERGTLIRRHWSVENELHGCLDVAFREDAHTTAAGHGGANLGLVRRVAVSRLRQDSERGSIKAKRLRAGWDDDYRLQVLQGFVED